MFYDQKEIFTIRETYDCIFSQMVWYESVYATKTITKSK